MNKRLTPEFPPHIKPVHVGYYPVTCFIGCERHYWNGVEWQMEYGGVTVVGVVWRGFTEKQE